MRCSTILIYQSIRFMWVRDKSFFTFNFNIHYYKISNNRESKSRQNARLPSSSFVTLNLVHCYAQMLQLAVWIFLLSIGSFSLILPMILRWAKIDVLVLLSDPELSNGPKWFAIQVHVHAENYCRIIGITGILTGSQRRIAFVIQLF